jgi:flagellar protein FliO/FliZ
VTGSFFQRVSLVVLMTPLAAFAQTESDAGSPMASPANFSNLLSLIASLIFVVGAILFVGWIYSRMRGVNLGASKVINVLAAQALGPKEKIFIVQIGSKQIALGLTASSLQTLYVFDEPVVAQTEAALPGAFADRLRSALGRNGSK